MNYLVEYIDEEREVRVDSFPCPLEITDREELLDLVYRHIRDAFYVISIRTNHHIYHFTQQQCLLFLTQDN